LVRKDLEVTKCSDLLHFFASDPFLALLLLLYGILSSGVSLYFCVILDFLDALLENGTMFELIGNLVPEVGEVMSLEGTLNDVLFLIVIAEEGRVVGLMLDITVTGWNEVAMLRSFSLVLAATGCHCNELYTYNHHDIKARSGKTIVAAIQLVQSAHCPPSYSSLQAQG
jgi:hypothetical protein